MKHTIVFWDFFKLKVLYDIKYINGPRKRFTFMKGKNHSNCHILSSSTEFFLPWNRRKHSQFIIRSIECFNINTIDKVEKKSLGYFKIRKQEGTYFN